MKLPDTLKILLAISVLAVPAAFAASQTIWGSTDRGPVAGTYRIPVDTSSSSAPGYITPTELLAYLNVTSSTPDIAITGSGTNSITIGSTQLINAQGATTPYTILSTDIGKTVTHSKATPVAVTLPQAGSAGFATGVSYTEVNLGVGTVTITPTTSTINGNSTLALTTGQGAYIISDGVNYIAFLGAAGSGTVSSVALSIPGIFTVSGSPVTTSGTLTATPSGTSGGVPYFSSSTSLASSGALTANAPVIGGGAGSAPTVGTRSGSTTTFGTTIGTLTSGHCVSIDGSGNLVDAGGACTVGGGGGTVTSSTIGQVPVYTGATTVTGAAAMTYSSGALTLGTATSVLGSVVLSGSTSGTTTLNPNVAASGILTLPAATDMLIGKATIDTLTNKTYDTAGTGNVFKINGTAVSAVTGTGSVMLAASPTTTGTLTAANVTASKAGVFGVAALSVSGGAIATDASLGNHFRVTPAHSASTNMSAPSNPTDGQKITYELVQDATGSGTISWNSVFAFGTSGAPTLTTTANKRDLVGFVYSSDSVHWLYLGSQLNF